MRIDVGCRVRFTRDWVRSIQADYEIAGLRGTVEKIVSFRNKTVPPVVHIRWDDGTLGKSLPRYLEVVKCAKN